MRIEGEPKTSPRESLYEQINKPSPLDPIAAILIYSGGEKIPADTKSLHDFIREKRGEEKYKKFLGDFAFSQTDIFPFSRSLEEGIVMLQLGGLLVLDNPQYGTFSISKRGLERAEKRIQRVFKEEDIRALKELGKEYGDVIREELAEKLERVE
jgi:hypothetical protein